MRALGTQQCLSAAELRLNWGKAWGKELLLARLRSGGKCGTDGLCIKQITLISSPHLVWKHRCVLKAEK